MKSYVDSISFLPPAEQRLARDYESRLAHRMRLIAAGLTPQPVPRPAVDRFEHVARDAAGECQQLLAELSPEAAVAAWWRVKSPIIAAVSKQTLLNRFLWILAVGASGDSHDPSLLNRYFAAAGCWWVASSVGDALAHAEDGEPSVFQAASGRDFLHGTSSQTVRYGWINRMICAEIGRQIEADNTFRTALPDFTVDNIVRCLDISTEYGRATDGSSLVVTPTGDPGARFVGDHLAVAAGSRRDTRFPELAQSTEMNSHPWVSFSDGVAPIAQQTIQLATDRALLAAIDHALLRLRNTGRHKLDKGELYERVAQQCVRESLHWATDPPAPRPVTIRTDKQKTDVDCLVTSEYIQIIGEVKGKVAHRQSADRTFTDQVTEIAHQLTVRLHALDRGAEVVDAEGGVYRSGPDTIGIGIVLHDYSGSLSDARMLALLPPSARSGRIAVADLHSWILVLNTMESFQDLREYLRFRHRLHNLGVIAIDEADIAVAFCNPHRGENVIRHFRRSAQRNRQFPKVFWLEGMAVTGADPYTIVRPDTPAEWRQVFFDSVNAVPFPF